jgi:predicted nucleic acid-binding protein
VVETLAVARRRFGPEVTALLIDRVLPALDVVPVDADLHAVSMAAFRDSVESSVSLVDRTSFAFMRREGIEEAIALDIDFRTAGFTTLP